MMLLCIHIALNYHHVETFSVLKNLRHLSNAVLAWDKGLICSTQDYMFIHCV